MNQRLRPASVVITGAAPSGWIGGTFIRQKVPAADP